MSEAAIKDLSAPIWYGSFRRHGGGVFVAQANKAPAEPAGTADRLVVTVRLYGFLATSAGRDRLVLSLPAGATVGDVLARLRASMDLQALDDAGDGGGGLAPCCRMFLDGYPVEDLGAPLTTRNGAAALEMILLQAFEGG